MFITQLTAQCYAPQTDRARTFIDRVVQESRLLSFLNNFRLAATNHQYRPAVGGQTMATRTLTGSYTAANLTQAELIAGVLAMHGFVLDYDESHEKDHDLGIGVDIDTWLDQELEERAIDVAEAVDDLVIAGSGTSNAIAGIATILNGDDNIPGLGITGVVNAADALSSGPVSLDLTDPDNFDAFLEFFDKVKKEVSSPDGLIMNDTAAARMATIARKFHMYSQSTDEFGKPVERINGVAIVPVTDDTITNDEPDDTAETALENTTSMYLVTNRVGHWNINSNSGLAFWDVGELEGEKMSRRVKFEIRGKNEIRRKRAIRRIRNIKL